VPRLVALVGKEAPAIANEQVPNGVVGRSNLGRSSMPRELVEPHKGDKRYVRRGTKGKFSTRQVKVGRSLSSDRRSKAKTVVKKGEGDRGDRPSD
jgi:hypothetical protein